MSNDRMVAEIAAVRKRHRQAVRRGPADRDARATWSNRSSRSSRAVRRCSWPDWECPPRWSTSATATTSWWSTCAARSSHARRALEAGCDIVVAQGTEAGGHTGLVATMPLVPQIVDAVGGDIPVVAAGGIFDGRGLAAALALGADGVWIGTRFIATPEARGVAGYKDALIQTAEDGTTISRAFSGKTMRVVRNQYTTFFEENAGELSPFPAQLESIDARWRLPPGRRREHRRCRSRP